MRGEKRIKNGGGDVMKRRERGGGSEHRQRKRGHYLERRNGHIGGRRGRWGWIGGNGVINVGEGQE